MATKDKGGPGVWEEKRGLNIKNRMNVRMCEDQKERTRALQNSVVQQKTCGTSL